MMSRSSPRRQLSQTTYNWVPSLFLYFKYWLWVFTGALNLLTGPFYATTCPHFSFTRGRRGDANLSKPDLAPEIQPRRERTCTTLLTRNEKSSSRQTHQDQVQEDLARQAPLEQSAQFQFSPKARILQKSKHSWNHLANRKGSWVSVLKQRGY